MKILMAGLGSIGQRHVRNLRTLLGDSAEILAYRVRRLSHVVTPQLQADRARDVEREYNIRVFDTLDSALAESPDIAFVTNPSSLHIPVALACAQAGCDLFLEKPVSNSMEGIADLLDEVDRRSLVAMVGYQLRFHPALRALTEIVQSGVLGHLLAVRATVGEYLPGWHPYEDYRQMYASRASLGGGVILSQIHEFDYLYSLFGPPRRLYSLGGHHSSLEIDVEDVASTLMECEADGRTLPVHLQQDYLQRPASRDCEVIGDSGKAAMDLAGLEITRYGRDGMLAEARLWQGFDRNQLFLDQTRHFLDCVESRRKPVVDLADGVWSLRIALAAKESIARRRAVELEDANVYATSAAH
jgi:predicted dehydrogenase